MSKKQKIVKKTVSVTPQTAYNLERLAQLGGLKTAGRVVDKLVREKMIALREHNTGAAVSSGDIAERLRNAARKLAVAAETDASVRDALNDIMAVAAER